MINFTTIALEQLEYWAVTDKKTCLRIFRLIQESIKNPFSGIGKPEPLKGNFKGYWSKRIDDENRLVYKFEDGELIIHSCRFHY
jgi:toxin YoeB